MHRNAKDLSILDDDDSEHDNDDDVDVTFMVKNILAKNMKI